MCRHRIGLSLELGAHREDFSCTTIAQNHINLFFFFYKKSGFLQENYKEMQGGLRLAQYWILLRMALSQSRPSHGEKITGAHKHKQHSSAKSHFMTAAS